MMRSKDGYAILLAGARFGLTTDELYLYSIRGDSLSRSKNVNADLCRVNDRVRRVAGGGNPKLARLLRRRSHGLQYEVFSYALKQRELPVALRSAVRMPLPYLAQRMGSSAVKKLQRG